MDGGLMNKREKNAVENFLASLPPHITSENVAVLMHETYENARSDCKSYGWSDEAMTLVVDGIGRHFAEANT
jgi:hypothetical protein